MAQPGLTAPVVAVVAAKGGVGKTTVAASLCSSLAASGLKVLAIDLDPQNALRFHLVADLAGCEAGLASALLHQTPWTEVMRTGRGGVVLLPFGSIDDEIQFDIERYLAQQPDWLRQTINGFALPPDTVVVLDTPPGPSVYLQQALRVAHINVVTLLPDAASFATMPIIDRMIDKYCTARSDFVTTSYLVNQLDASKRLARDVLQALRSAVGDRLLGAVHLDQAVSEALASAVPLASYAPHSQATHDFDECARQLMHRLGAARLLPGTASAARFTSSSEPFHRA